jgi:hypothetical protein
VPDAALVMVIQVALLLAVHALFGDGATTVTAPLPLAPATLAAAGLIAKLGESCTTVNVNPAIVSAPVRAAPVLAASE